MKLQRVAFGVSALLVCMVLLTALNARKKEHKVFSRLCGVVDHVEYVPAHGSAKEQKKTQLSEIPMVLYEGDENTGCCDNLKKIGDLSTGKHGDFDFKDVAPGNYWLSMRWNEKDYKIAFTHPVSHEADATCSSQGIDLQADGKADWWMTITVD